MLSPNVRRSAQIGFFVVDWYVRQVRPTDRQSHDKLQMQQMPILANSRKSILPTSADFFPLKFLKVTRNFLALSLYN